MTTLLFAMLMAVSLNINPAYAAGSKNENEVKASTFYYCADRFTFPPETKYFDYDSRPWKEEEKATVSKRLEELKKEAPGIVALASEYGKIPILRSPNIPYKNILGKTTNAYVLAVDGALFIADGAEEQKDYKRILLHELVHMADLGRHVAYSQAWATFAQPSLQRARRQVSCQFLLDAKAEDFADTRWPSTESCTSYKESLCEFASRYVLNPKFKKSFKDSDNVIKPLLQPTKTDLDFAKHYMAGRIHFRNDKPSDAIAEFELAAKADEFTPSPHVFLAQCWYEKKENEKARDELKKAKELFERSKISMTESLHWRTVSMLANSYATLERFDEAKPLLDRLSNSRVQYDASIFLRRSRCNQMMSNLPQTLLDFYEYEYLNSHSSEPAHYFDFIEDKSFLQTFLSKPFPNADGRRSHVFSICWERLALATKGSERSKFIESALTEVGKAASAGYYSKDEEVLRRKYLSYLNGDKQSDYEKLVEVEKDKKLWREFDLLRYLTGKQIPPKGEEFAKILKNTRPTDPKETKWLF